MKRRPFHFALIGLLLGSLPPAALADDPAKPAVKGNISIQLPRGWRDAGGQQSLIGAVAPQTDKDNTGQFLANLTISQAAGGQINPAAQQAQLARQYPTYRAIEPPAARVINGMQVIVFGGTLSANNVQLRTRQYMFSANNQTYIITFTSLASRWAAYQLIVEASVGTFSVKK